MEGKQIAFSIWIKIFLSKKEHALAATVYWQCGMGRLTLWGAINAIWGSMEILCIIIARPVSGAIPTIPQ